MNIQDLINGPLGILFILGISRIVPPSIGHRLANKLGRSISRNQNSPMVKAVRANQWVVSGCSADSELLDRLTEEVFINHGRALYDYYRHFQNLAAMEQLVTLDDSFISVIEHSQSRDQAQLLLMPHFANYELAALTAAYNGLTMQVLSYPNPGRGYRWQNKFRNVKGVEITPISVSSLRTAFHTLENRGTVFTGIDRPYGESALRPLFFGRPSSLPTGYIRLAIKTDVPIKVIQCSTTSDGKTTLSASDPIPVIHNADPDIEQLLNVSRVLSVIETQIRSNPAYWSMFYPVWPEALQDIS